MLYGEASEAVAEASGSDKKHVKAVMAALTDVAHKELASKKVFMLAGFAKFVTKIRPARKAKKGINPFTKEPCVFKAKPASKTVKCFAMKKLKEML